MAARATHFPLEIMSKNFQVTVSCIIESKSHKMFFYFLQIFMENDMNCNIFYTFNFAFLKENKSVDFDHYGHLVNIKYFCTCYILCLFKF